MAATPLVGIVMGSRSDWETSSTPSRQNSSSANTPT